MSLLNFSLPGCAALTSERLLIIHKLKYESTKTSLNRNLHEKLRENQYSTVLPLINPKSVVSVLELRERGSAEGIQGKPIQGQEDRSGNFRIPRELLACQSSGYVPLETITRLPETVPRRGKKEGAGRLGRRTPYSERVLRGASLGNDFQIARICRAVGRRWPAGRYRGELRSAP